MGKHAFYILVFFIVVIAGEQLYGQKPFSIYIERFKLPGSKELVMEKAYKWIQRDPEFEIIETDSNRGILRAKAKFNYKNEVVLEEIFLSPRINEKTSGIVKYLIIVTVSDTSYTIEFANFQHVSTYDAEQYSFGIIPKRYEDFYRLCNENHEWCKLVWMDITKTAKLNIRMKRIKANW
ncbi:MAG: hypothetical protein U9R19_13410 [Bacteroidota bacterium]|nr:hypothetical protein [Bacteroidota bacterium]